MDLQHTKAFLSMLAQLDPDNMRGNEMTTIKWYRQNFEQPFYFTALAFVMIPVMVYCLYVIFSIEAEGNTIAIIVFVGCVILTFFLHDKLLKLAVSKIRETWEDLYPDLSYRDNREIACMAHTMAILNDVEDSQYEDYIRGYIRLENEKKQKEKAERVEQIRKTVATGKIEPDSRVN